MVSEKIFVETLAKFLEEKEAKKQLLHFIDKAKSKLDLLDLNEEEKKIILMRYEDRLVADYLWVESLIARQDLKKEDNK